LVDDYLLLLVCLFAFDFSRWLTGTEGTFSKLVCWLLLAFVLLFRWALEDDVTGGADAAKGVAAATTVMED